MPRLYSVNFDASASGDNDLYWTNRSAARNVRRIHFYTENADIEKISIHRDGTMVHEAWLSDNNFDIRQVGGPNYGRVPQTGYYHFDPAAHGYALEGLFPTASNELFFRLKMKNAGNVKYLVEEMHQVAPLKAG